MATGAAHRSRRGKAAGAEADGGGGERGRLRRGERGDGGAEGGEQRADQVHLGDDLNAELWRELAEERGRFKGLFAEGEAAAPTAAP